MIWRERESVDNEEGKGLGVGLETRGAVKDSTIEVVWALVSIRTKLSGFKQGIQKIRPVQNLSLIPGDKKFVQASHIFIQQESDI